MQPAAEDAVLLGVGMVAATAAGLYPDLVAAARGMEQGGSSRAPDPAARERFERDYAVFLAMHRQRRELDRLGLGVTP